MAYFDEDHNWFCDRCIERGEEVIREKFRESAEHYRKHARQYDEAAEEEINILSVPDGVQRGYAELEEMRRPSELDVSLPRSATPHRGGPGLFPRALSGTVCVDTALSPHARVTLYVGKS